MNSCKETITKPKSEKQICFESLNSYSLKKLRSIYSENEKYAYEFEVVDRMIHLIDDYKEEVE